MDIEPKFIDYRKFGDTLDFYESRGYRYIEVPWIVSDAAISVTLPPGKEATTTGFGALVGSAEQSFIQMLQDGITISKACAITPCFRDEPGGWDELHQPYFMKLELINTDASDEVLSEMIDDATENFNRWIPTRVEKTEIGYDIVAADSGIELGSYGWRQLNDNQWFIYGTGLALPRLDVALGWQGMS